MIQTLLPISILVLFVACTNPQQENKISTTTQQEKKGTYILMPVNEFEKNTANCENLQLVDVRTDEEVQEGKIECAVVIDYYSDDFESKFDDFNKDQAIYLYCRSGGRSKNASDMLINSGFKEVYDLSGGIIAWKSAGKKLVTQ